MTIETLNQTEQYSFKEYLFNIRRNRYALIIVFLAILIQFIAFKYLYPFASYIHGDSFSYIRAAINNSSLNTYLIGYSKFLRLFSVFSKSDLLFVLFQYLFIQCSSLLLLFTVFYFYKLSKSIEVLLLCFMTLNPLLLHLGNMVSSDGIFLALSFIWFSLLLWIVHQPSFKIVIWHGIVILLAFTVRYNALIYPFISVIAFYLSKMSLRHKIVGVSIYIVSISAFISFTSYEYKKLTGFWQYSPFSGWQLANNAMYSYRYVDKSQRKEVKVKYRKLDNMIREYFDSTRDLKKFPLESIQASTIYMWTKRLTLYKYRELIFAKDSTASEFKKWASMGPFYKDYGSYIITKYPMYFFRYFVYPNALKYYAPQLEFLGRYNSGRDTVTSQARQWFNYKSNKVKVRSSTDHVWILSFYPILSGVINIVILFLIVSYIILKGGQLNSIFQTIVILGSSVWLLNAVFTIFVSSVALRFQSFPILLTTIFTLIMIDWLMRSISLTASNIKTSELDQFAVLQK